MGSKRVTLGEGDSTRVCVCQDMEGQCGKEGGAMHRHVSVSQLWGQRQNLRVPPGREARVWACSPSRLITHSPHSPQLCSTGQLGSVPGAEGLQGWPGGGQALLGSSLQGPWGSFRLARQTLYKKECELSGHQGPSHLTHPTAPRTPAALHRSPPSLHLHAPGPSFC